MYLDDCIVYGTGEAEFLTNLKKVLRDLDLRVLDSKLKNAVSPSTY